MRIHTNAQATALFHAATASGTSLRVTGHGSRTHDRSFDVHLTGSSNRRAMSPPKPHGASDDYAATWDEWGVFLAHVFAADPDARCGRSVKRPEYADAVDFHNRTFGRFGSLALPDDTHQQHRWTSDGDWVQRCTKCSAQFGPAQWHIASATQAA